MQLHLSFPAETRERLDRLKEATGDESDAEVVANAIRVYEWFVLQRTTGREVMVCSPGAPPSTVDLFDARRGPR